MPEKKLPTVKKPAQLAPEARHIVRQAIKVSLATNDRKKPWPFLSLTSVATLIDGTPILLLSNIAHHTRNIAVDPHISLLFDQTPFDGNPLQYGRITLHGILDKANTAQTERRFMARHPEALYAQFADFDFYTLDLKSAHYVAGFGSTTTLGPNHLLLTEQSAALTQAEAEIINDMNNHHHDAIQTIAHKHASPSEAHPPSSSQTTDETSWVMTGLDCEGIDLINNAKRQRIVFPKMMTTPEEIHIVLREMAQS